MSFNSLAFLIYLPVVLLIYWLLPFRFRVYFLLVASYFFYAFLNPWLIFLILATTLMTYGGSLGIEKTENPKKKKAWMVLTVTACLLLLFVFKYLDFAITSVVSLANLFHANWSDPALAIILPIGISFYTFQTLSYVIDVYHGKFAAERNIFYYALYVSYFPQLVAGPIERPEELLPQLKTKQTLSFENGSIGLQYLISGFVKKVVVADFLALAVDPVYGSLDTASGASILVATLLFFFQIYADFSGYSDIAIGSARLMGIKLTDNFDKPYLACSVRDFWKRWHITLSRWLTDYLYIPLGGNRKGKPRQLLNVLIVFTLSGLWHGANWTFVLWGVCHGLAVGFEDLVGKPFADFRAKHHWNEKGYHLFRILTTFVFVTLTWIFFRSQSVEEAFLCFEKIFTSFLTGDGFAFFDNRMMIPATLGAIVLVLILPYLPRLAMVKDDQGKIDFSKLSKVSLIYVTLIVTVTVSWLYLLSTKGESGFIYFQF
ncbi:MAG: MBOAT family protein [Bacilli bacterium]|jgi:D-alanyl-lipoteichoic acid acyltransferase DltB (MBOAT superfamily)|nr:MBOAT family protein [Bacilli bacterium]